MVAAFVMTALFGVPNTAETIAPIRATTFLVPSEAFPTIQSAIDFSRDGDAVEVAPGVYRGPGNRDLDFRGTDLRLYSAGGAGVTTIDCEGSPLDPHQGVVFDDGETLASTIEGFTFIGAYALGKGSDRKGGAILCRSSSQVTLRNCIFLHNDAARGAAVYTTDGGRAEVFNCQFRANQVSLNGGAISAEGGDFFATDCDFSVNGSDKNAGALGALSGATIHLTRCRFRANEANDHGGALFIDRSTLVATDCQVSGNVARLGGALFSMRNATSSLVTSTVVANSVSQRGGAIYLRDSAAVHLDRSILWENCEPARENDAFLEDAETRLSFTCSALRPEHLDGPEESIAFEGLQVFEDPMFCDPSTCQNAPTEVGDYRIEEGSPCAPARSPCGERIGEGEVSCGTTPVLRMSWGVLKARWTRSLSGQ